jgi:hypothetical protein
MALTECAKHVEWTLSLLQQLNFEVDLPLWIYSDSLGAHAITNNNIHHKHTKHINIHHHYVCDVIECGAVDIKAVGTKNNVADLLTKALSRDQHCFLLAKFGLVDASSVRECCENNNAWVISLMTTYSFLLFLFVLAHTIAMLLFFTCYCILYRTLIV